MTNSVPLISFRDAAICNGDFPVLSDFNFDVRKGDFIYLTGKVGTGKTSIIRTIIAENPLVEGEGSVCGFDIKGIRERDIPALRRKIGVVFQDFQLLMDRSVHENLKFVLKCTGWKDEQRIDKRIAQVLEDVGMETKAHKMPFHLSGGEQQRIAIARALLNTPKIIIADEPTGNLDAVTADEIMELLCKINREMNTAIVMVTHNNALLDKYPGTVYVCRDERCIATGEISG